MTKFVLWAGDGDSGSGGVRIIDSTTGDLVRDITRTHVNTDNTTDIINPGVTSDYFFQLDSDGSLVCMDKDNVFVNRVDLGYSFSPGETLAFSGTHVCVLTHNRTFEDQASATNNLSKLRKFTIDGLMTETSVVLNDPLLGDEGGNSSLINDSNRIIAYDTNGFWVKVNSAAFTIQGWGFVKVNYSGAVIDQWESEAGWQFGGICHLTDTLVMYSNSGSNSSAFTFELFDFATKTRTAHGPYDAGAAFTLTNATGSLNWQSQFNKNRTVPQKVGTTLLIPSSCNDIVDADYPLRVSSVHGAVVMKFDLDTTDVVCTAAVPTEFSDGIKNSAGYRYPYNYSCHLVDGDFAYLGHDYGVWKINHVTNALVWNFAFPYGVQQGYSSDGERIGSMYLQNWNTYTINGTVTDSADTTNRTVRVHDQSNGEVVSEATVTGGAYSATCLSTRKKYVVCESLNNTKNFEINAHLTPA